MQTFKVPYCTLQAFLHMNARFHLPNTIFSIFSIYHTHKKLLIHSLKICTVQLVQYDVVSVENNLFVTFNKLHGTALDLAPFHVDCFAKVLTSSSALLAFDLLLFGDLRKFGIKRAAHVICACPPTVSTNL